MKPKETVVYLRVPQGRRKKKCQRFLRYGKQKSKEANYHSLSGRNIKTVENKHAEKDMPNLLLFPSHLPHVQNSISSPPTKPNELQKKTKGKGSTLSSAKEKRPEEEWQGISLHLALSSLLLKDQAQPTSDFSIQRAHKTMNRHPQSNTYIHHENTPFSKDNNNINITRKVQRLTHISGRIKRWVTVENRHKRR